MLIQVMKNKREQETVTKHKPVISEFTGWDEDMFYLTDISPVGRERKMHDNRKRKRFH